MDSEETPLYGMEEMEASSDALAAADHPGTGPGKSPEQCLQWPWTVVERWSLAPKRRPSDLVLPQTWTDLIDGGS